MSATTKAISRTHFGPIRIFSLVFYFHKHRSFVQYVVMLLNAKSRQLSYNVKYNIKGDSDEPERLY